MENSKIVVKNEKNCTKCGDCVKACRYGAIILYE
ncbi:4Fe-4S binding protein [Methanocaldococcus sp. 10A]